MWVVTIISWYVVEDPDDIFEDGFRFFVFPLGIYQSPKDLLRHQRRSKLLMIRACACLANEIQLVSQSMSMMGIPVKIFLLFLTDAFDM